MGFVKIDRNSLCPLFVHCPRAVAGSTVSDQVALCKADTSGFTKLMGKVSSASWREFLLQVGGNFFCKLEGISGWRRASTFDSFAL
eukprot:scaffold7744_cov90-Cylindrotheca_fusiformis.AAC.10